MSGKVEQTNTTSHIDPHDIQCSDFSHFPSNVRPVLQHTSQRHDVNLCIRVGWDGGAGVGIEGPEGLEGGCVGSTEHGGGSMTEGAWIAGLVWSGLVLGLCRFVCCQGGWFGRGLSGKRGARWSKIGRVRVEARAR